MVADGSTYSEEFSECDPHKRSQAFAGKSLISGAILLASAAFGATVPAVLPFDLNQTYSASAEYSLLPKSSSIGNPVNQAQNLLAQSGTLDAIAEQLDWSLVGAAGDGPQTSLDFLSEIMTGREMTIGRSEAAQRTRLEGMLSIAPAGNANGVIVSASAADAQFAADSANAAAVRLAALAAGTASSAGNVQIDLARKTLEQAQIALDNSGVSDEEVRAERQVATERDALSADVERLQTQFETLTGQGEALLKMKFSDVLTQVLPEDMALSGLENLRQRYLSAKMNVDQLSAELGPRHPRFLAAKAAADEGRAAVARALSVIVTDINRQKATAAKELEDLRAKLAVLQNRTVPEAVSRRLELENNLEVARKSYLETMRQSNVDPSATIKVAQTRIASADDVSTTGLPHWIYTILGALAGLCLGGACLPSRATPQTSRDDAGPALELPMNIAEDAIEEPVLAPAVMPVQATVETLQQLDDTVNRLMQDELERQPVVLPRFDDYYHSEYQHLHAANRTDVDEDHAAVEDDRQDEPVANDDRSLEWLTNLIVANKVAQSTGEPLPYLLANIMQARSETAHSKADEAEAELQLLLAELEVLRQELAEHEAASGRQRFALAG